METFEVVGIVMILGLPMSIEVHPIADYKVQSQVQGITHPEMNISIQNSDLIFRARLNHLIMGVLHHLW